jgi:UDP-N-acetylglucosamine diphosphorylase/glucosamine-1-phosphate N-acetyltransferase
MNFYLSSSPDIKHKLWPFSSTRSVSDFRIGILTIREKWERLIGLNLQDNVDQILSADAISIPAHIIPTKNNFKSILEQSERGVWEKEEAYRAIDHPARIFQWNDECLRADFELLTQGRTSKTIDPINRMIKPDQIFLEAGAKVFGATLNASTGPIYIGKNAEIMEGSCIRGPFSLGENSVVKMGATIYGATTIGPNCVVGGEIKNSVFFENSNKAHHGYLGDSVIGAWCNLGAGTTNSNVKNTGGNVVYKTMYENSEMNAGLKGGVLMGDYSRTAVQTAINTGTIIGVCNHVFGSDMPSTFLPSFRWGNERYALEKALEHIRNWKSMKGQTLEQQEIEFITNLYQQES